MPKAAQNSTMSTGVSLSHDLSCISHPENNIIINYDIIISRYMRYLVIREVLGLQRLTGSLFYRTIPFLVTDVADAVIRVEPQLVHGIHKLRKQ